MWGCKASIFYVGLLVGLAGCADKGSGVSDPEGDDTAAPEDGDGDGFAAGEDCDDEDAGIYPGASELCDGADNDCDASIDEDAADAPAWYVDADGDGYGAGDASRACEIPKGSTNNADDCDDDQPLAHPGGSEACDGFDNDCDGSIDVDAADAPMWYPDGDGDGYGLEAGANASCAGPAGYAVEAGDCDDAEPAISPGAAEICGDAMINDCDSSPAEAGAFCPLQGDLSLSGAHLRMTGVGASDYAGRSVAGAGDWDGDGLDDLIVGASGDDSGGSGSGGAHVVLGGSSGSMDLALGYAWIRGEDASDFAGVAVAGAGDVDGDGLADVLVGGSSDEEGGSSAGAAWLLLGGAAGYVGLADAQAKLVGEGANSFAGIAVAGAGDADGDGLNDLLVGASGANSAAPTAGAAYLVVGTAAGSVSLAGSRVRLLGEAAYDNAGYDLDNAGDTDGDGLADLLVGAPGSDAAGEEAGLAYLVLGGLEGTFSLADADARLLGEDEDDQAGASVAGVGDVDGDGRDDLLIGAYNASGTAGAAYLALGGASGASGLSTAYARLLGEAAGDSAGRSVAGPGDIDGDGLADLLVGASGADGGAAYLVLGGASGTLNLSAADARFLAESAGDSAGLSVSGAGDADGDGLPDFLIGAPTHDPGSTDAGAAYLFGPRL